MLLWVVFNFHANINFHLKKSDSIYAIVLVVRGVCCGACMPLWPPWVDYRAISSGSQGRGFDLGACLVFVNGCGDANVITLFDMWVGKMHISVHGGCIPHRWVLHWSVLLSLRWRGYQMMNLYKRFGQSIGFGEISWMTKLYLPKVLLVFIYIIV